MRFYCNNGSANQIRLPRGALSVLNYGMSLFFEFVLQHYVSVLQYRSVYSVLFVHSRRCSAAQMFFFFLKLFSVSLPNMELVSDQ